MQILNDSHIRGFQKIFSSQNKPQLSRNRLFTKKRFLFLATAVLLYYNTSLIIDCFLNRQQKIIVSTIKAQLQTTIATWREGQKREKYFANNFYSLMVESEIEVLIAKKQPRIIKKQSKVRADYKFIQWGCQQEIRKINQKGDIILVHSKTPFKLFGWDIYRKQTAQLIKKEDNFHYYQQLYHKNGDTMKDIFVQKCPKVNLLNFIFLSNTQRALILDECSQKMKQKQDFIQNIIKNKIKRNKEQYKMQLSLDHTS